LGFWGRERGNLEIISTFVGDEKEWSKGRLFISR
jgi:hypothetical protein